MTVINPLASLDSTPSTGTASGTGSSSSNPLLSMSTGDTFLQLLVAQLKYQDPSNPADPTQFLSQTAQMSEAANVAQLSASMQTLQSDMDTVTSTSMIGKQITAKLADGTPISGVVSGVGIEASGPVLNVAGKSIPLSAITSVTAAPAEPTSPSQTAGASPTTDSTTTGSTTTGSTTTDSTASTTTNGSSTTSGSSPTASSN